MAQRPRLDEDVAQCRRLHRSGEHGQAGAVGGALAEQLVERAAADEVDRARVDAAQSRGDRHDVGEGLRERLDDAADVRRLRRRRGEPVLGAPRVDARGHVSAGQEPVVVDVEDRHRCGDVLRGRQERGEVDGVAVAFPPPQRLGQHPQPHDVVQQSHAPVDAALVREVRRSCRLGQDGLLDLDADEAPRAARDVDGRRGIHRHGDDGGCRVVRADGRDGEPGARPDGRRDRGGEGAQRLAGGDGLGEQPAGEAEAVDEDVVPAARAVGVQAGGRRVGLLGARHAGEPEGDEVGDQEHRVGEPEQVGVVGRELVEGVERQELQSVAGVEELAVGARVRGPHAPRGALVAIVVGVAEQPSAAEQPVVDGPRVDPDARDARLRAHRLSEPARRGPVQREHVPVQAVARGDRLVAEAGDGRGLERVRRDAADDDPAARRAEVDRRDGCRAHRRKAAATPESTGMWRPVVRDSSGPVRT